MQIFLLTQYEINQIEIASKEKGFINKEEYLMYLVKKDIDFNNIQQNTKKMISNLQKLAPGSVFSVSDLIELEVEQDISAELVQEQEVLFEIYLTKTNQLDNYEVLFLDEHMLIYTYLKIK